MGNDRSDIVIIGAGPAGLMAACQAAGNDRVTVLEQLPAIGRKLLATGAGKCNLTNRLPPEALAERFGRQWRFLLPALRFLPPEALRGWFAARGVPTRSTDGFHVFPVSERAGDVLCALENECRQRGVRLVTGCSAGRIVREDRGYGIETGDGRVVRAGRVIITTGGCGYPALGGRGGGYRLAEQIGHEIVTPCPAMVGLRTPAAWVGDCAGIVLPDCSCTVRGGQRQQLAGSGALLFTHHGVSGPAVLDISGRIAALLAKRPAVTLEINLLAERRTDAWLRQFQLWRQQQGKKFLRNLLGEQLPLKLADHLCRLAGLDGSGKAAEFTAEGQRRLAAMLTALPMEITATDGWNKAMVTHGGVSLKKVDPATLESRLQPGIYFAGEVLDVDGPCGGYNLQWAFSSGALAGFCCAARGL